VGWEVSRFPVKSFLPLKIQLKEKKFLPEPGGLELDCGQAWLTFA